MQSKDFDRMIKLGEWLEEYLAPNIPTWKLLKLFQAGAYLIGVNEKISPTCEMSLFFTESLPEDYSDKKKEDIKNKASVFVGYSNDLQKVLEAIIKFNLPWEKILVEFESDYFLHGVTSFFRSSYSELRETIKKIDGEYCVAKSFSKIDFMASIISHAKPEAAQILSPYEEAVNLKVTENPTFDLVPNYIVIISRIFFDFLILGGQGYFLFCEYCGRFTVIRRKGRKKYCSDVCRTTHGREKRLN